MADKKPKPTSLSERMIVSGEDVAGMTFDYSEAEGEPFDLSVKDDDDAESSEKPAKTGERPRKGEAE
jgi:hypothetical protein